MVIVVALVVGVICAYASTNIAREKGYEPLLYGVLGFCLGVIGLIVALVIPDKSNKGLTDSATTAEALTNYKKLLDEGILSQEEFDEKKRQLLEQ